MYIRYSFVISTVMKGKSERRETKNELCLTGESDYKSNGEYYNLNIYTIE